MGWWLLTIFLLIGASAIAASDETPESKSTVTPAEGLVVSTSTMDHSHHLSGQEGNMSTNSTSNHPPDNPSDEGHTSTNVTAKDSPTDPSTISDITSTSPTNTPVVSSSKPHLNSSIEAGHSCHALCDGSFECSYIQTCECQLEDDLQVGSIKCGNDSFVTKYTVGMNDVKVNCKSKGETKDLVNKIISLFKNTRVKALEIAKCSPFTSNKSNADLDLPNKMNIPEDFSNPLNMSAFSPMRQLNSLILSYTYLTSLSGNVGKITPDLKHLSFNNNLLKSLPDDIFSNLTQIQNLSLAKNLLKEWGDVILKNLSTIENLDLSENQIGSLKPNVFIELVKLKKLDLSVNNMPHIPTDIFSKNIELVELNLGNISSSTTADIPSLKYLKNLKILWLHKNKLATVNADLVSELHLLEDIHLEYNHIKTVPSNIFENNVNLKNVFFNNNQLELLPNVTVINPLTSANYYFNDNQITKLTIPFPEALQRATTLNLSNNCISTIINLNSTINNKLTNLECVQCCLTDINEGLMKSAKSTVNLSGNKISKLDNTILKSMMHLDRVNLTHNRIMTMNFTLDYPLLVNFDDKLHNSTTAFDINNNIVICDCHLLPLIQFINSSFKMDNSVKSNITFTVDNLQCSDPPHLRNTSITNLTDDQLVCNPIECPHGCSCFSNPSIPLVTVNCSSRGLTTFPKWKTNDNLVKLYLRNNSISFLPDKNDSIWAQLVALHLSNNNISSVKNLSVSPKLKYLWLEFNQFQFDLDSLKQISRLHHVWLNGNPWKCDCDIEKGRSLLSHPNVVDRALLTCKDSEDVSHKIINITNNQFCETQSSAASSSISPVLIFLAVLAVCVFVVAAIVIFVRVRNRSGYIPS